MKKAVVFFCIPVLLLSMCGCSGLTGGMQQRNIGTYVPLLTDGETSFLQYELAQDGGYFCAKEDGFTLSDRIFPDAALQEQQTDTQIVASLMRTGIYENGVELEEAFAFLAESLDDLLSQEDYQEYILLCRDGEFYGILNCYKRPAGRSGSMLAYEDLKYSCLLGVEDGRLTFGEKMKDVALLACNQTHYVAYQDRQIYSVCKATGETTQILEDQWWDTDENKSYVNFFFGDEVFYFSGRNSESNNTLYACYMDGSCLQQLKG